ncbi:MAG: hypothetical protein ACRCX4_07350 [Bacteroidales bacterium]
MTTIERIAIIELLGIASDRKLILTFNTIQFQLSENEIIASESFLFKYLGIEGKNALDALLNQLAGYALLDFKSGTAETFHSDSDDLSTERIAYPDNDAAENDIFYKISLSETLSNGTVQKESTPVSTENKTVPPPAPAPALTIEKKISKPVANKANDIKISIEQFSMGEYPEARADAEEYMDLYGLTLEQYQGALHKFCRMKSQSGYMHMNHFMFKCQFNLYIKKNLKHIIV